jgi:hypothetical protein
VSFRENYAQIHTFDGWKIKEACTEEIKRRIERYTQEVATGNERRETLLRAEQIYSLL